MEVFRIEVFLRFLLNPAHFRVWPAVVRTKKKSKQQRTIDLILPQKPLLRNTDRSHWKVLWRSWVLSWSGELKKYLFSDLGQGIKSE